MPIGRPPTVNTLRVPGGISATGATTYLRMACGQSHVPTPSPLGRAPRSDRVLLLTAAASYATGGQADNPFSGRPTNCSAYGTCSPLPDRGQCPPLPP